MVPSNRTGGIVQKLMLRNFSLNIRKNFFTLYVTENWNKLLGEVVDSASLEISKKCLDTILCYMLWGDHA